MNDQSNEPAAGMRPPPFSSAHWFPVIPVTTALLLLAAIGIVLRSYARERPGDLAAAGVIVALAVVYAIWAGSRRSLTLPVLVGIGALVQLLAVVWYHYSGFAADASIYSRVAATILDPDESVPALYSAQRSEWSNWAITQFTAGIYRITGVSRLAAFVVFGALAVVAKALFASSLLRVRDVLGRSADIIAIIVMIYPSLALWLGAISKEVPAVLGMALVVSGLLRPIGRSTGYLSVATGLAVISSTRPHVAALVAGALVVYAATSALLVSQSFGRRVAIVAGSMAFGLGALLGAAAFFDIDPSPEGFQSVRDDVAPDREQGDSDIEPRPVRSPVDVPMATANVLLRPFPHEAAGPTGLLQSMETMALIGLGLVLLSRRSLRRQHRLVGPTRRYVQALRVFAVSYLLLFIYAFSGMYNLGLMSRQRTQATLFILLLLATSLVSTRKRPKRHSATTTPPLVLATPTSSLPPPAVPSTDRQAPSKHGAPPPSGGPLVLLREENAP